MQELWLRTRIRRRDYAQWPDLRGFVTRARTPLPVKMSWGRLHVGLATRAHSAAERVRLATSRADVTMARRLDAIRNSLGAGGGGTPSVEARQLLRAYWRDTWICIRRFELWRINPVRLAWSLARDARNMITFLAAAGMERY